jgi:signal transduction histidine kinase
MNLGDPLVSVADRYNLNINLLNYRTSNHEQLNRRKSLHHKNKINQEVILFMNEQSINVNFFVIDKEGNFIYKNEACNRAIEHDDATMLPPETWEVTSEVMRTRKQIIAEERSPDGTCYLSVKSPLIIDEEVEGIIGLAVDITDRKKSSELEQRAQIQEIEIGDRREFGAFTAQVLHDIISPLLSLEFIIKSPDIPEQHHILLKEVANSIKNIVNALSEKYKEYEKKLNVKQKSNLLISLVLEEAVRNKRYQYQNSNIKFNYTFDQTNKFTFIECDCLGFSRMISNLLNNAAEACDRESGLVEVSFCTEKGLAKIVVKDNGVGMPKEIVERIRSRSLGFGSAKHSGSGLGLGQIIATVESYKGILEIESREKVGTTFCLKFPLVEVPSWVVKQVSFKKEDMIVVVDDDSSIFSTFEELLGDHFKNNALKFFRNSKDALDFIESFPKKESLFFLSDYELRGGDFNGLTVIMQSGLPKDRCHIITSLHGDKNLQDIATTSGIKIVLKQFLKEAVTVTTCNRYCQ